MRHPLIILCLLSLGGCISLDDFTPATVSQLVDTNTQVKKNAEIIASVSAGAMPDAPITTEAKLNAENAIIQPKPNGFDFLNETIMGLIMASTGLGGLMHHKKKVKVAGNQDPDEFNKA